MQAECLRSQIAPLAARYRSCSSNRQRTSAAQCLGSQFAPLAARCRSCSSNRQRTCAAQCLGCQFAPLAARYRSCSSSRQRTSAAQCLGCQFAPPGSSLPLVLIKPPAHVRGPVPGLSIRALAARYRSCSSNRQRTSAAQCLGSQFAPLAARCRSCSSNRQRTCAAQCLGCQFAPWSGELRSRLCKPPAHVRAGGCAWNFLRPRTLYFTGPALDFCEFSLNFPCIFGKIGIRKQPLSQIF